MKRMTLTQAASALLFCSMAASAWGEVPPEPGQYSPYPAYPQYLPPPPPPPKQAEEVALPVPQPTCCDKKNPFYYMYHSLQHGVVVRRHHGRFWQYVDGEHHGWPYGCSSYEPRAAGASYTFPQWVPRRSYYYAYGGDPNAQYGFSPEPYYHTPR